VIGITTIARRQSYVYHSDVYANPCAREDNMALRRLTAATIQFLVLAVGLAIAAPYVLILLSPFISGR
jgi:hypothetical protein